MRLLQSTLIALFIAAPAIAQDQMATVLSVGDGDTIAVRPVKGKNITIRMGCIDAPELKQAPWGAQSRSQLQALLPVNSQVTYRVLDTDRYGRSVAEVFVSGRNINLAMVESGHAVAYRQYLAKCDGSAYLRTEDQAKKGRLAFWSQAKPVMPWDFRRGATQTATTPKAKPAPKPVTSECDPNYRGACIPLFSKGDVDCGQISARRFQSVGTDPHRLDGDKDGIACE